MKQLLQGPLLRRIGVTAAATVVLMVMTGQYSRFVGLLVSCAGCGDGC